MDLLKDVIQRCHERHEKPLRQRKTVVTPLPYNGLPYHFTVYCAHRYRVQLDDVERAGISFMPTGRAPVYDQGPRNLSDERFRVRQGIEDWEMRQWHRSWGLQVYTGIPSEHNDAQWHDLNFTYQAICAAPDAVIACVESVVNAVANPLLTISKSGGLRFSCRVQSYLHPNSEDAKLYIYEHAPTSRDPYQRNVYLEILGDKEYSRWDGRYEILLGNLLEPPIISKEVLFAPIDVLRAELHKPVPPGEKGLKPVIQTASIVPPSLGSYNLDLAKEALLRHGFSYVRQDNGFYYWLPQGRTDIDAQVSVWESDGTVWLHASMPDMDLPIEAAPITEVWDDTGILPRTPTDGLSVSDEVLAVREGKLSPLAIKRQSPVLYKPEQVEKVYGTLEENAVQMQSILNGTERVLGLIAEKGAGKSYAAGSYVLKGSAINLSAKFSVAREVEQDFQKRNVPSFVRKEPRRRRYLWEKIKEIPVDVRMANPFQHGNTCEDPDRCEALERKGGDPRESICPKCPVYTECQQHGYLSQSVALQGAQAQILGNNQLFFDPQHAAIVEEILGQDNETERLCIVDEAEAHKLFLECKISKKALEAWSTNWQGHALGNFARALLNALETKNEFDNGPVRRVRTATQVFEEQAEALISQMGQLNVRGKVVARGVSDDETGNELAHFSIEFEGGVSAYIPLDAKAADRLKTKDLRFFSLDSFVPDAEVRIPMEMAQAIELGILDASTVENIEAFPTVYPDPKWTLWHQLKRFFAHYKRDTDAPMIWYNEVLQFWVPPVLHTSVKRFLLTSSGLSDRDFYNAFPDEKINVTHIKPTAWVEGNQVFQIRSGIYTSRTLTEHYNNWDIIGMSKLGQRIFSGICAEIEQDSSVKHAIITYRSTAKHLTHIAEKENVCFISTFSKLIGLQSAFEEAEVIWIIGTRAWGYGIMWRRAQILFGNDEKPLSYEVEVEPHHYKDERIQSLYEQHVVGALSEIVGRTGLNRLGGKKVVLVTHMPLPDITDRPETLLFDWEDFEIAGGLNKLPEVIATRERFETERANLTAETSRTEVERILGCSSRQANRVLSKLRGGNIPRVLFREQIFSLLANGEKKTSELVDAIDGHPTSVRNELKRLVDADEIVKVRWGVYALPKSSPLKH